MTTARRRLSALGLAVALGALAVPGDAVAKRHGAAAHPAAKGTVPAAWLKQEGAKGGARGDGDRDGLTNQDEWRARTSPVRADSDRDGVRDGFEDGDRDGVDNGTEVDAGTDPRLRDSDGDGVRDALEDTDRDGLANGWEDRTGHDPRRADGDRDGMRDAEDGAGAVARVDAAGWVTISLATGGELVALLDEASSVSCTAEASLERSFGGKGRKLRSLAQAESADEDWDPAEGGETDVIESEDPGEDEPDDGAFDDGGEDRWSAEDEGELDDALDPVDAACLRQAVPGAIVHQGFAEDDDGLWLSDLVLVTD